MNDARNASDSDLQLIDVARLATMTGLSKPTIWRHNEAGLIPAALKIGRAVRWKLSGITCWIHSGCPTRSEFEQISGSTQQV